MGTKITPTCISGVRNDIIWLVQGGIYHKHSLCKYRGKSSCVGSTGAFIYFKTITALSPRWYKKTLGPKDTRVRSRVVYLECILVSIVIPTSPTHKMLVQSR